MEATEKQILFAEAIANTLNLDLPKEKTKFAYQQFISIHKENYDKYLFEQNQNIEYELLTKRFDNLVFDEKTYRTIQNLNEISGIYFLWSGDTLVYIGKSVNLRDRILSSVKERNTKYINITHISYVEIENIADVHITEPILITKYKPILNYEFKSSDVSELYDTSINPYELEKLVAYKENKKKKLKVRNEEKGGR